MQIFKHSIRIPFGELLVCQLYPIQLCSTSQFGVLSWSSKLYGTLTKNPTLGTFNPRNKISTLMYHVKGVLPSFALFRSKKLASGPLTGASFSLIYPSK